MATKKSASKKSSKKSAKKSAKKGAAKGAGAAASALCIRRCIARYRICLRSGTNPILCHVRFVRCVLQCTGNNPNTFHSSLREY